MTIAIGWCQESNFFSFELGVEILEPRSTNIGCVVMSGQREWVFPLLSNHLSETTLIKEAISQKLPLVKKSQA